MTTATPIGTRRGKYGRIIVWDCGDHYVSTSSADHYLAPSSAMSALDDMAWIGRALSGRLPANNHVQETVCFKARSDGQFHSLDEIGRHEASESHLEAIRAAGYEPSQIPDHLPEMKDAA